MKEKNSSQELNIDGVVIAPGVAETIISLAVSEVEGVAGVGNSGTISSLAAAFSSNKSASNAGINLEVDELMKAYVSLTIQVYYGYSLVEVAQRVREACADALKGQIGIEVVNVDISIDAITSKE
jgi:uncharacterized alkaline shock family protein YloU